MAQGPIGSGLIPRNENRQIPIIIGNFPPFYQPLETKLLKVLLVKLADKGANGLQPWQLGGSK